MHKIEGGGAAHRELVDAHIIPWEADQGIWGVALEYSHGQKASYSVGTREEANAELLAKLKELDGW